MSHIYIYECQTNPKNLNGEEEWSSIDPVIVCEVFSAHRFDKLNDFLCNYRQTPIKKHEYIKLTYDELKAIVHFACEQPDELGSFGGVPQLCNILHNFNKTEAKGWYYWYHVSDYQIFHNYHLYSCSM